MHLTALQRVNYSSSIKFLRLSFNKRSTSASQTNNNTSTVDTVNTTNISEANEARKESLASISFSQPATLSPRSLSTLGNIPVQGGMSCTTATSTSTPLKYPSGVDMCYSLLE